MTHFVARSFMKFFLKVFILLRSLSIFLIRFSFSLIVLSSDSRSTRDFVAFLSFLSCSISSMKISFWFSYRDIYAARASWYLSRISFDGFWALYHLLNTFLYTSSIFPRSIFAKIALNLSTSPDFLALSTNSVMSFSFAL